MTTLDELIRTARELALDDDQARGLTRRARADERRGNLLRADVPLSRAERLRLIDDEGHVATPAFDAVRAWLDAATRRVDPGPIDLVLSGPEGRGRTYAASWAIASEGGLYRDVDDLVFQYRRAKAARATLRERRELDRWRDARVLVIARVGEERDDARDALSEVFHGRETPRSQLTVLLTTLAPEALLEHARAQHGDDARCVYDARTNERLRRAVVVAVDGGES